MGSIGLGLNGTVPVLCFGEAFLLPFLGTTFFHCSMVPVHIIFPGVSSVGDESVLFFFSLLFWGFVGILLLGSRTCGHLGEYLGPLTPLCSQGAFDCFFGLGILLTR